MDYDLYFPSEFIVSGAVLQLGGAPISKAIVRCSGQVEQSRAATNANGEFLLRVRHPGVVFLSVSARGFALKDPVKITLTEQAPIQDVVVFMSPAVRVVGKVRWSDGAPIKGAIVSASRASDNEGLMTRHRVPRAHAISNAEGIFEFVSLHPDRLYLLSSDGGRGGAARFPVEVELWPGSRAVEMVFERSVKGGLSISGIVTDATTSAPIPHFELEGGTWIRGQFGGIVQEISDEAGVFVLGDLRAGQYGVVIRAEGYAPKTLGPLHLEGSPLSVEVGLERPLDFTFYVVDEAGRARSGASVSIWAGSRESLSLSNSLSMKSDSGGACLWRSAAPGSYLVQAKSGNLLSDVCQVSISEGFPPLATLVVSSSPAEGALAVRVVEGDGAPCGGCEISVIGGEGAQYLLQTDEDGNALLSDAVPGAYVVWAQLRNGFASPVDICVVGGAMTRLLLTSGS